MLNRIAPQRERGRNSGEGQTRRTVDRARPPVRIHRAKLLMVFAVLQLMLLSGIARAQSAEDGFNPGALGVVYTLALQPDGKILAGGGFSQLGGQPRSRIGRLNQDGTIDNTFIAVPNGIVYTMAVLPDRKILVGGQFTQVNGQSCTGICRLSPNGAVDTSFNAGANGTVYTVVVQPDGKIVVGGGAFTPFTQLGGQTRLNIGRLNPDGTLDTAFNPGADGPVDVLAVQPDGKIIVGGIFTQLDAQPRSCIGRLNLDGTLDTTFDPGASARVLSLAVQSDGKIVVAGVLLELGGQPRTGIGRLNANGSLDASFNSGSDGFVNTVAVQPDGKIIVGGDHFTQIGGQPRSRIARLNQNGTLDATFNPGANQQIYALAVQSDAKVVFGGNFTQLGGQPRSRIARVNSDATLDSTLNPGTNGTVETLAVQLDGKILVGGGFTQLGGQTRLNLARLNADGSVETTFNPGANGPVRTFLVQPDGKIIVGGSFSQLGGDPRDNIGRLNPDGTLDTTFNPGAAGAVFALTLQPDGKIIVGGEFSQLGGQPRSRIGRLNADGTLDASFSTAAQSNSSIGAINALAVLADGKIIVGGDFSQINGQPRDNIARIHPDGTLDVAYNPGAGSGLSDTVATLVVQPDGKIVVGGFFSQLGGQPRASIGRLNPDGSPDSFNPVADGIFFAPIVHTLALQSDGKILLGGTFGGIAGLSAIRLARLNADGTRDFSFPAQVTGNTFFHDEVNALALQPDGKILFGGLFTEFLGTNGVETRNNIGRLTNTSQALQNLSAESSTTVNWSRGGASPELSRVAFELSTDGFNYAPLGDGTPVTGGWQLTGLSLPQHQNIFIRARGFYSTGAGNGSVSIVESVRNEFVTIACITLTVDPASLPGGTINTPYSQALSASGGDGPYTFAVAPTLGALPTGLTLDPSTGLLSGTPTRSGTHNFTVIATDTTGGCIGRQAYAIVIACTPITFSPTSLPNGVVGTPYSQTITASGANDSFTFARIDRELLPPGLTLDQSTGVLSGSPSVSGTFTFTIEATGTVSGCKARQVYSVAIDCTSVTLSPSSLPNGVVGAPYSQTMSASSGFDSSFFFVVSYGFPPGLRLSESGMISGTPSASGIYNFTIVAVGATSFCEGTQAYSMTVDAAPAPVLAPAGLSLVNESCPPFNSAVDPGERVTVNLRVVNNGNAPTSNLIATLQSSANVIAPSNARGYGALAAFGGSAEGDFSFTALGSCGDTLTLTLRLHDGPTDLGTVTYAVPLGAPGGMCTTSCAMVRLVVTSQLTRLDANRVRVTYSVQNIGAVPADDVQLTTARLGAMSGEQLPQGLGNLAPGQTSAVQSVVFVFNNSTPGTSSMLTLGGTYTGGTFTSTKRVTIP